MKRSWCWEWLRIGGEGDDRGWDGWMASPIQWTWVWVDSGSWWWTGRPGVLWFMESQRVRRDWATELNWINRWKVKGESVSYSVMSNSLRSHGLYPIRLLCPYHFPAKILEWVAVPFSKGSSWSKDWTQGSYIAGRFFTVWAIGKAPINRFSDNIKEKNLWVMNSLWAHIEYTDFKLTSERKTPIQYTNAYIWNLERW